VVGWCEGTSEASDSITEEEFLDQLCDCHLLISAMELVNKFVVYLTTLSIAQII
jgi:hypothetical protein